MKFCDMSIHSSYEFFFQVFWKRGKKINIFPPSLLRNSLFFFFKWLAYYLFEMEKKNVDKRR
jgi:hypothetical protein